MNFEVTEDQRTKFGLVDTIVHNVKRLERGQAERLGLTWIWYAAPDAARRVLMGEYTMPALRIMRNRVKKQFTTWIDDA